MRTLRLLLTVSYILIILGAYVSYRGYTSLEWRIVKRGVLTAVLGALLLSIGLLLHSGA